MPKVPQSRLDSIFKWVFITLLFLHLAGMGFYLFHADRTVERQRSVAAEARDLEIKSGESLNQVLDTLRARGLAPAPLTVRVALLLRGEAPVVKRGSYVLPETTSTVEILRMLDAGRVRQFRLTVPEGLDKWQLAELLGESRWGDAATFLALIEDPEPIAELDPEAADLEGYLFPETYYFSRTTEPKEIIAAMVNQFKQRTQEKRAQLARRGLGLREWVALASLVEKEAAVEEERGTIAGVFQNRLDRGMLLQCDPTIIYSLKRENRYRGKIYKSDIRYESPYNTYVVKGLPPGPIASPGYDSLSAAMTPEETQYLYFMARDDGTHQFSKNLRDHNRAVRRWRK